MNLNITLQVENFLARPLLGRLATASPDGQPHVVPVWFLWEDGAVWISSYQSTRKVIDLEKNAKCALVVDVETAQDGLTAVTLEGDAELLRAPQAQIRPRIEAIYTKYLGEEGLQEQDPQTWLNSPENLLIKFTPRRVKTW